MTPIVKTLLTLTIGAGLTSGVVAVKKHPQVFGLPPTKYSSSVSPIAIHQDGTVVFLGRVPPAAIASDIRASVRNDNTDNLNRLLVEHRFYVIPESAGPRRE